MSDDRALVVLFVDGNPALLAGLSRTMMINDEAAIDHGVSSEYRTNERVIIARFGKMPTTSVRRRISLFRRSYRLFDQTCRQCESGNG